ncbi:cytochrome P450 [Nocardia sp. Marseille-Q1738]
MQQTHPLQGVNYLDVDDLGQAVPLYTNEFAADPHGAYRRMRKDFGSSVIPVEIDPGVRATLVIGLQTAVEILNDPARFPHDPRRWQQTIDSDCPILPMMGWRPNALRSSGAVHARYRGATNDALAGVDQYALLKMVEAAAEPLIRSFPTREAEVGRRTADLITSYIQPLVFNVLCAILGCPASIGEEIAAASAALFDSQNTWQSVNERFEAAFLNLVRLKRAEPGNDVATRLVQHPANLTDVELVHAFVTCFSAGMEPGQNLIANSALALLTDPRFSGFFPFHDVVHEVMASDPSLANYCITYPPQRTVVAGVWLPADRPVIVSMAACCNDPNFKTGDNGTIGSRWNIGFGNGPHECPQPAQAMSYQIAVDALTHLFDQVPELRLAVPPHELRWRPGPFHRALEALPVVFPYEPLSPM